MGWFPHAACSERTFWTAFEWVPFSRLRESHVDLDQPMKRHIHLEVRSGHAGVYSGSAHADTPEPEPVVNTSVVSTGQQIGRAVEIRVWSQILIRRSRGHY